MVSALSYNSGRKMLGPRGIRSDGFIRALKYPVVLTRLQAFDALMRLFTFLLKVFCTLAASPQVPAGSAIRAFLLDFNSLSVEYVI